MKLWSGRFSSNTNELLDEFNASIEFDKNLWCEDILGSKEHAKMLHAIGILSKSDLDSITRGLDSIYKEIENGEFKGFVVQNEDIHMAIESALSERIGEAGKRLHTARSRNDQVALDFTLYCRNQNLILQGLLKDLMTTLLNIAEQHTATLMPGMTHLQHAQPISFGYHLVAWCAGFKRDIIRLQNSYDLSSECPLGSAALAGTPYNNERENLAKSLGFKSASLNAMDSVGSRDFALDLLYNIAMVMLHISRVAEELIIWSSAEFNYVTFSDTFSTGSSIMPQKKNPDVAELLRGKSGRSFGNLMALLTTMKALPYAYNKDMQEDKEGVFDSINTSFISLKILNASLKELKINTQNMLKMCQKGHLVATDLADFLVAEVGIPFRVAHHIVGSCVAFAESRGFDLSVIDISVLLPFLKREILESGVLDSNLQNLDSKLDSKTLKKVLDLNESMKRRTSKGGTAPKETKQQIKTLQKWLKNLKI